MLSTHKNELIESYAFRDILHHITFDTWVFVDLDNTIMESILELGSDQWFSKLLEIASRVISDQAEAVSLVISIYQAVQHHVVTKAIEKDTVKIISALQHIGIPVIALTARDRTLIDTTCRQLQEIGLNFSRGVDKKEERIELGSNSSNSSVYHRGIIFCNGNDKGKCLNAFLSACEGQPEILFSHSEIGQNPIPPAKSIMVDDKAKHVVHVKTTLESLGVEFKGIHYRFLDEKVKNLDMKLANKQLTQLKHKLSSPAHRVITRLQLHEEIKDSKDSKDEKTTDPFSNALKRKYQDIEHKNESLQSVSMFKRRKVTSSLKIDTAEAKRLNKSMSEPMSL